MQRVQALQHALERLASLQCELLGALLSLGGEVSAALQDSLDQCVDRQRRLREAHRHLYESVHSQQSDWEQAAGEAAELQASCSGQELEEILLAKEEIHTVTIESCSGRKWRAEGVKLQESPAVRLAMLQLLEGGRLHLQRDQQQDPAVQDQMTVGKAMITATTQNRTIEQPVNPLVLSNLWCDHDPQWTLSVLEENAPHVEELQLYDVGREHLRILQHMPRLRKLQVWDWHGELPLEPEPQPGEQPPLGPGALQWLEVRLPQPTVLWLLSAHRHSLRELRLCVGLPRQDGKPCRWPSHSGDLPDMLRRCGLPRLSRLTLLRSCLAEHCAELCRAQRAACRAELPQDCAVLCSKCQPACPESTERCDMLYTE